MNLDKNILVSKSLLEKQKGSLVFCFLCLIGFWLRLHGLTTFGLITFLAICFCKLILLDENGDKFTLLVNQ